MTFKVGDKVRCIMAYHEMVTEGEIYTVSKISKEGWLYLRETDEIQWWVNRFELAEQPEPQDTPQDTPQVGDVWGSEDKSRVVRVVGKFERNDITWISFLEIKGEYKGVANYIPKGFFIEFHPLLLHRPPKKQPKPKVEPPKKQEEVWEPVIAQGVDSTRCFRKGNSIKWIKYGQYEGVATCNKKDKFDLFFGIDLAWHRAEIKYCEAKIAEMIKEGVK